MRIAVAADERSALAQFLLEELLARGHEPLVHGALAEDERADWAWGSAAAALDVVAGRADQAIVCCWTGTGAAIAANKVAGVRAALCADAVTAAGARRWNDANVLALSLRAVGEGVLGEILDAWFATKASAEQGDRANVAHLARLDADRRPR
jgi:ribose 5-phosphate isomerase B